MKVAQAVSTALLGAVALSGATAAFAITDPGVAPTDLIVAVWNTSTNTSWVQDLGTPNADLSSASFFTNPNGFSTSYQVDTSGAQLATNLGAGTYLFSVFSVDYSCATCGTFAGNTEYFSLTGGQHPPPQINNGLMINNGENSVATYINANVSGAATTHLSGSNTSDYWAFGTSGPGINGGSFTMGLAWPGGASAGSTLELVKLVGGGTPGGADDVAGTNAIESIIGNSATNFGLFSFNQATGVLSYNLTPSAVPLPAAGWLLVSGLLALGAVARRRNGLASASAASAS
jgi:hypothetical protein